MERTVKGGVWVSVGERWDPVRGLGVEVAGKLQGS